MSSEIGRHSNAIYTHIRYRIAESSSISRLEAWKGGKSIPSKVVEVQMTEGVELPLRYDRTHLETTPRLVHVSGEERPLPIREFVLVSLHQPAWREFFGSLLHQGGHHTEAPLQNQA